MSIVESAIASPTSEQVIASFKLSDISNNDVSDALHYYSLRNIQSYPPAKAEDLRQWLLSLPSHTKTDPFGDHYVGVFKLHNDTPENKWFIYPYGSVVQAIDIRLYGDNSQLSSTLTGANFNNQHDFHYGSEIQILPGEKKTILMIFKSDYFFAPIKVVVKPASEASKLFNIENVILLVGLGICFALSIYNLFIYVSTRQLQYLTYAATTLAYMFGWAGVFGVPEHMGLTTSEHWLMPAFLIGSMFFCYFTVQFLRLDSADKSSAKAMKIIALVALVSLPFALYSQGLGLYLASFSTSLGFILGIYSGIKQWVKGYTPAKYYVFALFSVVLPNMIGNLMNFGILPGLDVNIYLLGLVGNCLDSLLLAFALAAQVRLLQVQNIKLNANLEQTVQERTIELKEANARLEQTNADLIEANEAKGRFLANMSHEIRTPLTSIIGYADGILMGDIDKSEQERVTKVICQNGTHLLNVINDILDISKIEANKLDFESIPTPLFVLLADIESLVGRRARDKGLSFDIEYQYPLPSQIYSDPTRLKQILFNLTNNAIKFTEQGHICLTIKTLENRLIIDVVDSGMGMSVQQQSEIFEPFKQADSSVNRIYGGTGLGLSISQRLAAGLNGHIEVDSTLGKGATFTLNILMTPVENTEFVRSASEIWQATSTRVVKAEILPNFTGQKVLLADDHPANRELISLLLNRMKLDVIQVEDGKQALEAINRQPFDLVLLDIHMPNMSGPEALKRLRQSGNNTPVVALTANNMKHEIEHYKRIGFSDHVAKPISRNTFISVLKQFLDDAGQVDSPISSDDMQSLIEDYRTDLVEQVSKLEQALEASDLETIGHICHRIRGSASAFGYQLLGNRYADIEHSAMQDDEIAVSYELPKLLSLTKLCTELPGVDIARGIINHDADVGSLLREIYAYTYQSDNSLQDLKHALDANQVNSALVSLYKLQPVAKSCGLQQSITAYEDLENLIKQGTWTAQEFSYLITAIEQHIQNLKHVIKLDLLNEL